MARLENTVVMITGARRASARASPTVSPRKRRDRHRPPQRLKAKAVAETLKGEGAAGAISVQVDVGDCGQVQAAIKAIVDSFSRLDVLFNNAGFNKPLPFLEVDEANFNNIMRVNEWEVMLGIQEGAKQMIAQGGGGKIINTASIAGRQGYAEFAPYCCSKSAVISLTQAGTAIRQAQDHGQCLRAGRGGHAAVGRARAGHDRQGRHQEEGRVHRELLGQHPARLSVEAQGPRGDRGVPRVTRLRLYHRTGHRCSGRRVWCRAQTGGAGGLLSVAAPQSPKAAMDAVECLVIGAGVVGLAVAARAGAGLAAMSSSSRRKTPSGRGMSSRNSEVIHAGIYYATGLAKTRLCVEGKVMLYRFCREYGVQHRTQRQADRRRRRERDRQACGARGTGEGERRRRPPLAQRRRGPRARAGAEGEPGAAFALDRHRRQSRPDAGAQG